jgi:transcriptional regulator with XRE-family HTH domain
MPDLKTKAATPVDFEVGRRVRLERLKAGLSQTALAEQIGVTFQQVQKYENGTNRVAPGRLSQIARILNLPISSFFEIEAKGANQPSSAAILGRPHVLRLIQAFDNLPDNLQAAVLHFVEVLASTKPARPAKARIKDSGKRSS